MIPSESPSETVPSETDVVVVGAGPTGLLLGGDLAAAGVRVVVLERYREPSGLTRAFGVHARTLEQLDARGVAQTLLDTGTTVSRLRLFGHSRVDLGRLPSRFPYLLVTPQYNVESLLARRAQDAGCPVVRGAEVRAVRQDGDGVDVAVADGAVADGAPVRASYVVGADGAHSVVRRSLGLPFPGEAVLRSVMLADVRLEQQPDDVLAVGAGEDGFAFVAPFGDGWYRIFAWDRHREQPDNAPVDLDEVRAVTRDALGTDFGMHEARWLSRFHSDERQAPRYRTGRVFLAGDAAHVHSPAGGQGMNTGLQDAANLSWKLAAAVHGWAPDRLLESYHTERHPVGSQVLRTSGALIRMATTRSRPRRLLRDVVGRAALTVGAVSRRVTEGLSGIGVRYPAEPGSHRLVGRRAADTPLVAECDRGGARLYEALREGKFVLLVPRPESVTDAATATVADGFKDRVRVATRADDGPVTLVRPDGYVGWASDRTDPERLGTLLGHALRSCCGPPVGA